MGLPKNLKNKRQEILEIAARHGARNVRVFGSATRNSHPPPGDVDLLVELEEGRSLLDQSALVQELEKLLGKKVDVVEPEGLHWYIRERVLREAVSL